LIKSDAAERDAAVTLGAERDCSVTFGEVRVGFSQQRLEQQPDTTGEVRVEPRKHLHA